MRKTCQYVVICFLSFLHILLFATLIADTLGTFGQHINMMGITLIALLLAQSLHGAAVAVIMTPVALDTAGLLGIEPKAFAVAVVVGAGRGHIPAAGMAIRRPDGKESRII